MPQGCRDRSGSKGEVWVFSTAGWAGCRPVLITPVIITHTFNSCNILRKRRTAGKLHTHFSSTVWECLPRKEPKTDLAQKQLHTLFTSEAKRIPQDTLTQQVALLHMICCSHVSLNTALDSNQQHPKEWERYYTILFLKVEHCGVDFWQWCFIYSLRLML